MRHILLLPALFLTGALAAQTTCDSIHIESVQYAPFGDGLHVTLHNGTLQFLNSPTLDVLDADGDTLAEGVMEFFGILPGYTNLHQVHFTPQPASPFTGTIRLHYNDGNGLVSCAFQMTDIDLCPPDGCVPLMTFAYQQGGDPVEMDLDWSVTDADNNQVDGGVLHKDGSGFGYVVSELCLVPGAYTLHMAQPVAAGNLIQVGMTQANFAYTDGVLVQLPVGGSVDLPFEYYIHCADGTQGISVQQANAPTLIVDGRTLRISTNDGSSLGKLVLLDGLGRIARTITANASTTFSDLSGFASGVYILRSIDGDNHWPAQRFILH